MERVRPPVPRGKARGLSLTLTAKLSPDRSMVVCVTLHGGMAKKTSPCMRIASNRSLGSHLYQRTVARQLPSELRLRKIEFGCRQTVR